MMRWITTLDLGEFDRALRGADWVERMLVNPRFWLFIALCAAVALLMASLVKHVHADRARFRPSFRRTARGLKLSLAQQQLMEDLAGNVGCKNATPLLISRGWFDHATERYPHRTRRKAEISRLRRLIFG